MLSQRTIATSACRPERQKTSTQSEVAGARGVGASIVDEHRRWGAQCSCHEAERRAGTSVVCGKLSRRLREALGANAVFLARVDSHERVTESR